MVLNSIDKIISLVAEEKISPQDAISLLSEAIKRVRVRIGGVYHTLRKTGRKDPRRSMIARRAAIQNKSSRRRGMLAYRHSPKFKMVQQARSRFPPVKRRRR